MDCCPNIIFRCSAKLLFIHWIFNDVPIGEVADEESPVMCLGRVPSLPYPLANSLSSTMADQLCRFPVLVINQINSLFITFHIWASFTRTVALSLACHQHCQPSGTTADISITGTNITCTIRFLHRLISVYSSVVLATRLSLFRCSSCFL